MLTFQLPLAMGPMIWTLLGVAGAGANLRNDDECHDGSCALHALQKRGFRLQRMEPEGEELQQLPWAMGFFYVGFFKWQFVELTTIEVDKISQYTELLNAFNVFPKPFIPSKAGVPFACPGDVTLGHEADIDAAPAVSAWLDRSWLDQDTAAWCSAVDSVGWSDRLPARSGSKMEARHQGNIYGMLQAIYLNVFQLVATRCNMQNTRVTAMSCRMIEWPRIPPRCYLE